MSDVLGYAGRRLIVAGTASEIGAAATKIVVDLGAEVHVLDREKPDQSGLASFTETDLRDPAQIEAAAHKIGRVVNALFHCALPVDDDGVLHLRHLVEQVIPLMIEGAAIATAVSGADGEASPSQLVNDYTTQRSRELFVSGIRMNCVHASPAGSPEDQAWPLVLLNSPRCAQVTGTVLRQG